MNPFDIGKPCINTERSEVSFKQYIMPLNWDKYEIEVRYYDAINCYRLFFDFMQRTFNNMDGLHMHKKCLLIDTIKED